MGGNPAGEMLRDRFLAGGEQADREPAGFAQQLVERGRARDRDPDKRRLDGEGDEGPDGQAEALAVGVHRDDGDAGGKPAHERAEVVHRAETTSG